MLLIGVGTDTIEIARINKACKNARFLERVFTPKEQEYCLSRNNPYPCLAARFAGKEAVLKAMGTGLRGCRFNEIEILPEHPDGPPKVKLYGGTEEICRQRNISSFLVSLSHDRTRAVAFAVAVSDRG